jgi:hypothetical protein
VVYGTTVKIRPLILPATGITIGRRSRSKSRALPYRAAGNRLPCNPDRTAAAGNLSFVRPQGGVRFPTGGVAASPCKPASVSTVGVLTRCDSGADGYSPDERGREEQSLCLVS